MEVTVVLESQDISSEDLYHLLQAIRDCEQQHFPEKAIGVFVLAPELSVLEAKNLLKRIQPPFKVTPAMELWRSSPAQGGE